MRPVGTIERKLLFKSMTGGECTTTPMQVQEPQLQEEAICYVDL